ncbi:MAG: endonuclease domain-containing protein, partial [Actinomycetota bacterium]
PTESTLETRFEQVLAGAGIPLPQRQVRVFDGPDVVARADFAYPDAKVILEIDGYGWHSQFHRWHADRARDNRLQKLGWIVFRFARRDLEAPARMVEDIKDILHPRSRLLRPHDG